MLPFSISASDSIKASAPISDNLSKSSSLVSSTSMFVFLTRSMSPVSSPSSICIIVTPVSLSPFITDHWIGAAPRYLGKSEAWTLIHPYFAASSTRLGKILPYATTTIISAFISSICLIISLSLSELGWKTSILCSLAHFFTAGGVKICFLPTGLSGWEKTAITLCFSINFSKQGTAKSGVPIKITFIIISVTVFQVRLRHGKWIKFRQGDQFHGRKHEPLSLRR